ALLGLSDLHPAAVADHPAVADPLIFAAIALPVLDRSENLLAEKSIPLGLERPVVDRLGLGDFPVRPPPDRLRRSEHDPDGIEREPPARNIAVVDPGEGKSLTFRCERRLDSEQFLHRAV